MFGSEEKQIAEKIKEYIENEVPYYFPHLMLRNGGILEIEDYFNMLSAGETKPQDAYVYILIDLPRSKPIFYYPFLVRYEEILNAYLSKQGFRSLNYGIAPATGLKYVVSAKHYIVNFVGGHENYFSIEFANLDNAVNNTNLRKIIFEVLGGKLISGKRKLTDKEYEKIRDMFKSQRLFTGYNFDEAFRIIQHYYNEGNKSLAKEVARIAMDYDRIFQPYTVCYDLKTWKEVNCWSIKLV